MGHHVCCMSLLQVDPSSAAPSILGTTTARELQMGGVYIKGIQGI